MSHSLSQAQTYRPPAYKGGVGPRHLCGCSAKSAIRLQSTSGELRATVGDGPKEDALDTVINVALIGGVVYLVYEIFFG